MMRWLQRSWFGLSLAGLLILALPALWLWGVNLAGQEGPLNTSLEKNYNLTYHIPIPWWGALLLFLVPLLLVLLYFLKLRRKPLAVPSTFLWRKSIEDLHVNSLFQWLRQNVLLLLQLLTVLMLMYGLLAPRFHAAAGHGKHYILMIDNSASMSATDVEPNRLEQAKAGALQQIDAAGDDDNGMVIVFNSTGEIRRSYTSNRHDLRQVVRSIEPTERPTRIDEALTLADSLANPTRSAENEAAKPANPEPGKERVYVPTEGIPTEVHLFSDGRFPDVPDFALGRLDLKFHSIGQPGPDAVDNVGIVNFNAVRDETDPTKLQLFARVVNYRPAAVKAKVQIDVRSEGRLEKVYPPKEVSLPARKVVKADPAKDDSPRVGDQPGEAGVTFELADFDDRSEFVIRARLLDNKDSFPLDDQAWLVVGVIRKAKVLIAGPSNPILDAFFDDESTRQVAEVTKITADDLKDAKKFLDPARAGEYDLVVFDRCAPEREDQLPRANTLFIGRPPPPWPPLPGPPPQGGRGEDTERHVEKVDNPAVKGWTSQHGLLRYLTGLHEIGISEAFRMTGLPPRTPRIMEGDRDLGLMVSLSRGAYTDVVMCFPILNDTGDWNTNWPLLPSFPLFWRNVLYTLGNIRDAAGEENTQPGQVKLLRPDGKTDELNVTDPKGVVTKLSRGSRADFAYGATDHVGVYGAQWKDGSRRFSVNLLDADESNIEPRPAVQIGAEQVRAEETHRQPRELWKWAVLAGLALLMLEWYVYNRRVFV
ncbi:MAG TPA: VWA domain-containing protein [Gemmataceae bacterium]|nr:VWA domain-containing protein [Gemmataceae bacterium]